MAAFRSDTGVSRQVLEAARARRFDLLLSLPLMLENESVLTRSEHLAASGASREDVSAVLDELARGRHNPLLAENYSVLSILKGFSGRGPLEAFARIEEAVGLLNKTPFAIPLAEHPALFQ